jgi:hypothetical protein
MQFMPSSMIQVSCAANMYFNHLGNGTESVAPVLLICAGPSRQLA